MSTKTITADRDERNRRLIAHSLFAYFAGSSPKVYRLLNEATPEEREAYVKKQRTWYMVGLALVAAFFLYRHFVPAPVPPAPPAPTFEPAGTIQDIQLQRSFWGASTTVRTTSGIFQVSGGVSAAPGDATQIKREQAAVGLRVESFLCVESKIKPACYSIY